MAPPAAAAAVAAAGSSPLVTAGRGRARGAARPAEKGKWVGRARGRGGEGWGGEGRGGSAADPAHPPTAGLAAGSWDSRGSPSSGVPRAAQLPKEESDNFLKTRNSCLRRPRVELTQSPPNLPGVTPTPTVFLSKRSEIAGNKRTSVSPAPNTFI